MLNSLGADGPEWILHWSSIPLGRASDLEQWDVAVCTQFTKRYIQLFARRKAAPVGRPFEIYARMSGFFKTPEGELSKLADLQKCERLKKILSGQTERMHRPCRHSSEKSDSERWPYSATGSSRGESVLGYYGGRIPPIKMPVLILLTAGR
jgi:hypothetical protein